MATVPLRVGLFGGGVVGGGTYELGKGQYLSLITISGLTMTVSQCKGS